ncbi:MAG TPA: DNA mismatch repair endonuclease MutL [Spirochaetales bacterium]|mgnify:CR=1 FL=1|nr:DNA mismatch repair endonuclease MutL [Spirochaetales bacterium]HPD80992.1 DNA mismatch repair endonuclease MutL [Spirochaetales bacterium]HQK33530.1 DNA mismatch repair endonuclease MutL [Spirochaetales bacterium]HRV29762.1 DNA mismatch repair endonuclease MutL [Spirochaetia bacterium]
MNKILKLPPETARKIAAGEVIERPQSVIRELLDNAIDAHAARIEVTIEQGGIEYIQVADNGDGIEAADLPLAIEPHATSKITQIDDLLTLHTLGFRGEALASIAAVAELEIVSALEHGKGARLYSTPATEAHVEPYGASKGTTVTVRNLFANFPARKKFLKYPHAESLACRQTFIEKAIPFPEIELQFTTETAKLTLPRQSVRDRIQTLLFPDFPIESLHEFPVLGDGFSGTILTASPTFSRKDRRLIQIYINNRKIQEFSVIQAIEYAFREQLPGGTYPCAILLLTIDPALVDFNVHPAKKEARIKNITVIRAGIIDAVKHYLRTTLPLFSNPQHSPESQYGAILFDTQIMPSSSQSYHSCPNPATAIEYPTAHTHFSKQYHADAVQEHELQPTPDFTTLRQLIQQNRTSGTNEHIESFRKTISEFPNTTHATFRYYGQFLLMFLLFERDGSLYILDQHAAHERILYEKLLASDTASQELLIPFTYSSRSEEEDTLLASLIPRLKDIHITLERDGSCWNITSVPACLPDDAISNIFELLLMHGDAQAIIKHTLATIACRAAVKEGELLDTESACDLIKEALALPDPHCPHGRPIWIELTEKELLSRIGRTIS